MTGKDTPRSRELTFELGLFPDRLSPRCLSELHEKIEGCPARRGSPEDYYPSRGSSRAQSCGPGRCRETSSPRPALRGKPSKHWAFPLRYSHKEKKPLSTKAPDFAFWVGTGSARKLGSLPPADSSKRARTPYGHQDESVPTRAQHPA